MNSNSQGTPDRGYEDGPMMMMHWNYNARDGSVFLSQPVGEVHHAEDHPWRDRIEMIEMNETDNEEIFIFYWNEPDTDEGDD